MQTNLVVLAPEVAHGLSIIAAAIGGYLIGSLPFGVIVTRLAGAGDPRAIGSGNIGATNVLRSGRKDLAVLTLLGDAGKGAAVVLMARWLLRDAVVPQPDAIIALAGGAAFVGHLFPVWLRFRGGKGVATFFGVLLAAAWPAGLLAAATWLIVAFVSRYSSLASLTAAALTPIFAFATDAPLPILYLTVFMAVLIFFRHDENIRRLLRGEESKIGGGKASRSHPT